MSPSALLNVFCLKRFSTGRCAACCRHFIVTFVVRLLAALSGGCSISFTSQRKRRVPPALRETFFKSFTNCIVAKILKILKL